MGLIAPSRLLAAAATLAGVVRADVQDIQAQLDLISPEPPILPSMSSVSFSGNGCPQGSAEYLDMNSRWNEAVFALTQFRAEDTAASPTERTQNCQLHANMVGGAQGWQVAVQSLTVRGFASLSRGSSFTAFGTVYWSQDATNVSTFGPVSLSRRRGAGARLHTLTTAGSLSPRTSPTSTTGQMWCRAR